MNTLNIFYSASINKYSIRLYKRLPQYNTAMTKYLFGSLLFILFQSAFADDFRGLSYDTSCDYIDLQEHNAGSQKTKKDYVYLVEDFTYLNVKFRGTSRIAYHCNDAGSFTGVEVLLPTTDHSFDSNLSKLNYFISKTHGQPEHRRDTGLWRGHSIKYVEYADIWPISASCNFTRKLGRVIYNEPEFCHYIALSKLDRNNYALQLQARLEVYEN